jgi:putative nucleotidyltransferase with HDIG domain
MLQIEEPLKSLPRDTALREHCRRVAGLSKLVAHHLRLAPEERQHLQRACLLHHSDEGLLSARATVHLLRDLFYDAPKLAGESEQMPQEIRGILSAWRSPGAGGQTERKLADILRLCDALDQGFEAQPLERLGAGEILGVLRSGVAEGLWSPPVMQALEDGTRPEVMFSSAAWRVPAFPQAAAQTLNAMRNPSVNLNHVVDAARSDPATAGAVMRLANSALFGACGNVSTLRLAIMRLGFETARRVVISLALRPLLYVPKPATLWPHSVEVADLAEQLAGQTGGIEPAEAYLAGLLHDVGRIALREAPLYDAARLQGLEEAGCPTLYAEELILRTDHAELGARIAGEWKLPEALVAAIRRHHQPEATDCRLAHVLYLAEYLACSNENLPSSLRLDVALKNLGLCQRQIESYSGSQVGAWLAAA